MIVDAVERGPAGAREQAADGLVGEQHELLDEGVRTRLLVPAGVDDAAVVDLERQLARREREGASRSGAWRATGVPGRPHARAGRPGGGWTPRQHVLGLVVGQARAAADQRPAHPRGARLAVGAHAQLDGDDATDLTGAQAAGAGRELERQHRLHAAGHVDAAGAPAGLAVECPAGLHVAGDVGDVHPDAHALAIRLHADRVVEVTRRGRVDRDRFELQQVVSLVLALAARRSAARLAQRRLRPLGGQAALEQQCTQHMADVVGRAQPLDDPGAAPRVLDHDELAGLHGQARAPAESQLLAVVEERLRDQEAPPALHGAGDEPRPVFLVVHRGRCRASTTARKSRCVFTVHRGARRARAGCGRWA